MNKKMTALVLTAALGMFAAFSSRADGDIYDISPCDAEGVDLSGPLTDYDNPLDSGSNVYFKVRLVAKTGGGRWGLSYDNSLGIMSEEVAKLLFPMQIGIYVSGERTYATLHAVVPEGTYTTAFIFSYTTKPGDFALPIRLATEDGPAEAGSGGDYVFDPSRSYWKVTSTMADSSEVECTWLFVSSETERILLGLKDKRSTITPAANLNTDITLERCGFYVKTVDFSDDWQSESFWRFIHENSTDTSNDVPPRLSIRAPSEMQRTFYVWSEDETIVQVDTSNTVEMQIDSVGNKKTNHVGTVTFPGQKSDPVPFPLRAMPGSEGKEATIVMSAYPRYTFSAVSGEELIECVKVPVKCVGPRPPTLVVERDSDIDARDFTITAKVGAGYLEPVATLRVYLTQPYDTDLVVSVTNAFSEAGFDGNWRDYVCYSTDGAYPVGAEDAVPSVTIPAGYNGKATSQKIYVFAKNSDEHVGTLGHWIMFFPSVDQSVVDEGKIENYAASRAYIDAEDLEIAEHAASATGKISGTCNIPIPFNVKVSDIFAASTNRSAGAAYRVQWKKNETETTWTDLPGLYYLGAQGRLYEIEIVTSGGTTTTNFTSKVPTLTYTTSNNDPGFTSALRVVSPAGAGDERAAEISFTAIIEEPKGVALMTYDPEEPGVEKTRFDESSEKDVGLTIKLSVPNDTGSSVYAYLVPQNAVDITKLDADFPFVVGMTNEVGGTWTKLQGIEIPINQDTATASLFFLDGTRTGQKFMFKVVISDEGEWDGIDDSKLRSDYGSQLYTVTVLNVEPSIVNGGRIEMNGEESEGDGARYKTRLPVGSSRNFNAIVVDPGEYDLVNTNGNRDLEHDPGDLFRARWSVYLDEELYSGPHEVRGDPEKFAFTNLFDQAGIWRIECKFRDKDMRDWSKEKYSVEVEVIDNPMVTINDDDPRTPTSITYYENDTTPRLKIGLSDFDNKFSGTAYVAVKVARSTGKAYNRGILDYSTDYKWTDQGPEGAPFEIGPGGVRVLADTTKADYYIVPLSKAVKSQQINIAALDGTDVDYKITAYVAYTLENDGTTYDKPLPTSNQKAAEYYLPKNADAFVENLAPVCTATEPDTNRVEVVGSVKISWSVKRDADNDYVGVWDDGIHRGIRVMFEGDINNPETNSTIYVTNRYVGANGTFVPDFGTRQGPVAVRLTIEDKDGGYETWTYLYTIPVAKYLRTIASGPSGGVGTMLSRKYSQAKGRGAGHVWVDGGESPYGSQFNFLWNCGSRTSVAVYGMGYKVGDVDNGTLKPYDFGISGAGAPADMAPYYSYADTTYDSFLYTWLSHVFGENAGLSSSNLGDSALPEIAGHGAVATPVGLPEAATEGGPYPETYVEAVFSREWREFDNCGDINQDGIPDRALIDYDFGVAFDGVGDLGDLSGFNGDNDFLPGLSTGGNGLVPNVVGAWQAQGIAFNAFLEIRGFGSGLNAGYPNGDGSDPEPDYSANEKRAWLEWKGVNTQEELAGMSEEDVNAAFAANVADAKADLAAANNGAGGWSPERPTNPTEEDTDKDGLADGYEYWFWYGAKVGYSKDGKWVGRMKGRRLNLDHLDIFDEIASDDVCLAFDPLVSAVAGDNDATRGSIASRDFDNDGLYDIEEYLIGTNPVDCDTDDGGVPDGFEIMWGFNPLDGSDENDSAKNNPDGDYMAYADMSDYLVVEFDADLGEGAEHYVYIAKEYDETAGVLTGSLLGTGDYADLVWKIGPDTVPKSKSIGASETVDLVAIGADSITATPVDGLSLVHNQVYNFFGFDPRTGWSIGCKHGYVAPRWCPDCNTKDDNVAKVGAAGLAVNTRVYTVRDEYYFGKYNGLDMKDTVMATLRASCTNPNIPFADATYGDATAEYASEVHGADSDKNGAPDGWEAYVGFNPAKEPESDIVGSSYRSNDGARCYGGCETVSNNTSTASGWYNKFFPTDPYTEDTDGDGIGDDAEGRVWKGVFYAGRLTWPNVDFTFIYGSPEDDGFAICIRGGGMNPCSTDTDLDGIPDAWEHQHPGIVVTPEGAVVNTDDDAYTAALRICDGFGTDDFSPAGNFITGGMDATDGTDAYTNPLVQDKHVGTIRDRDFDHDGLENFQEYLVQSVRCWRYDDVDTPLMGRAIKWPEGGGEPSYVSAGDSYLVFDVYDGAAMLDQVKASPLWAGLGAGSTLSSLDKFDYASLGYFAQCDHEWDAAYQFGFKYMKRPQTKYYDAMTDSTVMLPAFEYVSTDPRKWDSDADGMDDFWEIFHGLNPILGGTDLIAGSYIGIASDMNMWTETSGVSGYDPVALPWRMGVTDADPDGDGIRNLDEAIGGNLTSPTTYHTDPTPLWMTEPTTPASYVSQYYRTSLSLLLNSPWTWGFNFNGAGEASSANYMFSFDVTEGYDTDGDWVGDGHEVIRSATAISDPLDSGDPDRRAALYLPGANACAYSVSEGNVPVFDTYDLFRQFTVEAWIKPDVVDRKQTIVERGFAYPASNLVNAEPAWRANFRLEIDEDGVLRGVFDNDNAVQSGAATLSTQTIVGGKIKPEVWTHVAMTFDGINVTMYIDGRSTTIATSHLIPANGIISILQEPGGTNSYPFAEYATVPGANTVGARRSEVNFGWNGGFEQFTDFFKGYIAEVRFWDGARTASEIAETYKTRMTPGLAAEHREAVYAKWKGTDTESGATRNDMDGNPMLPAQLITVYNFQQLPAALSDAYVAQTPSGFTQGVQNNTTLTTEETKVGWWDASPLKSTVYKDTRVVPYAQNVVSHLAPLDGSCDDSMYWANAWAGYVPAADNGVKSYAFPNGGNPYKGRSYMMERSFRIWRWFHLSEGREASADEAKDLANRSTFQARSEFTGLDDLVPLGGAFAKLDAEYWDGQGASTAWSQTGTDADGDGLPYKWEENNGLDPNSADDWAAMVSYNGTDIPAWEAYLRDLAKGWQPDGSFKDAYKSTADADANGLLDWWQNIYALSTGASGDDDGDGLSNYVEYMLGEVIFGPTGAGNWLRFAPDNARSVNPAVSDYFYRLKNLYVGEVFTDHDQTRDMWESGYLVKNEGISPYLYDADVDADGDGWSNYAEFQAGSRPTVLASLGIDGVQIEEYPIPTIEMAVSYNGSQGISDKPIVVKAWSDPSLATRPDAIWTLGGAGDVSEYQNGGSNVVTGVRYIGMNPRREVLMHLSPGSVVPGTVKFEFKDLAWILVNTLTQQGYVFDAATAIWEGALIDSQHTGEMTGDIIDQGTKDVLGTIDYITGAVTMDFTKLRERLYIAGDISGSSGDGNWVSIYDLSSSYVRVSWQSKLITGGTTATYYLGRADEPSGANNSLGHVKQGLNTFIAFYDLDGNGMYTPGEPYGFARNVDVGWNYAKLSVELTDTSIVTPRYSLTGGGEGSGDAAGTAAGDAAGGAATDREQLWELSSTDVMVVENGGSLTVPAKDHVRVRIARFAIDSLNSCLPASDMAIVYDQVMDLTEDGHPSITEADILSDVRNKFDIDWEANADGSSQRTLSQVYNTYRNVAGIAFTNMIYAVYFGEGPIYAKVDTNEHMLCRMLVRKFDTVRHIPVPEKIPGMLTSPAPTFRWKDSPVDTTYTAFRIRIKNASGAVVWTSEYQLLPPRDGKGVYSWTPPVRVGATVPGGTAELENHKHYSWEISTYNARFKDDLWTSGGDFYTDVPSGGLDHGTARVAVRYYGPSPVAAGRVRVQAFTTPDFSGDPVAEGYVNPGDNSLSSTEEIRDANATIIGLKAGTYYIRAFIDTDGNGRLSTDATVSDGCVWESWGSYCTRDSRIGTIFTPKSVTVGPDYGAGDVIPVFIEDCDIDNDCLPDAWEWLQGNHNLATMSSRSIDKNAGGFAMNSTLAGALEESEETGPGLAVSFAMRSLGTSRVAALLLDVDATGSDDAVGRALNSAGSDATAEPVSVSITAIELDRDSGTVKITTDSKGTMKGSDVIVSEIYTIPSGAESLTLTCKVLHCDELGGPWKEIASKEVKIDRTTTDYTFDLGENVDLSSGFFKAKLEK